jgi:hypothetical protein
MLGWRERLSASRVSSELTGRTAYGLITGVERKSGLLNHAGLGVMQQLNAERRGARGWRRVIARRAFGPPKPSLHRTPCTILTGPVDSEGA